MAIVLYKAGDSHVVRGVTCEAAKFEVSELEHALSLGWKKSPADTVESNRDDSSVSSALDAMERDELKAEAKGIGLTFPANIGTDKLRNKIRKALG